MTTQYVNKATLNGTSTVYWVTSGAPDTTGAQSGYNIANLTNIAVDYSTNLSTTSTGGTIVANTIGTRYPIDSNDVLVWTLDEASSFANSGSATGISNLSILGTVNTQRLGLFGNCAEFPSLIGQNSIHGASTYGSAIGNNITISCWFNPENVSGSGSSTQYFVFKGYNTAWSGAFGLGIGISFNNNTIGYDLPIGGTDVGQNLTGPKLANGVWYHVGMTYDGSFVKIYLNGDLVFSTAQTGNIDWGLNNQDWAIGNNHIPATANRPFVGKIDDVRIANIARPASYFQSVYQLGIGYGSTPLSVPQLVTFSDGYANLPTPGVAGRVFLPTSGLTLFRDNGTSWMPFGPIYPLTLPPLSSTFSQYRFAANSGQLTGASAADYSGVINLYSPAGGGGASNIQGLEKTITPGANTLTALILPCHGNANYNQVGLYFRDSATDRQLVVGLTYSSGFGGRSLDIQHITSGTSGANIQQTNAPVYDSPIWIRIKDDGTTNITIYTSSDGITFVQQYSEGRTSWLTNGANRAAFFANGQGAIASVTLLSWSLTSP